MNGVTEKDVVERLETLARVGGNGLEKLLAEAAREITRLRGVMHADDERLRNVLSVVYGLLWPVEVDTTTERGARIREARQWCLRELTKAQQGDGIADANTIIHAMDAFPPYARRFEPDEAFRLVRTDEADPSETLREALTNLVLAVEAGKPDAITKALSKVRASHRCHRLVAAG